MLAIRPFIGMAFVSSVALTACVGEKALPSPSPVVVLTPAPRECFVRTEGKSVPADQIVEAMGGHVPHWLPPGFGLEEARTDGGSIWATWTDDTCRMVSVVAADRHRLSLSGPRVGPWVVAIDAPGCGNKVLGSANCLDYYVALTNGSVGFDAAGLDRTEADRIVLSIPLCGSATCEGATPTSVLAQPPTVAAEQPTQTPAAQPSQESQIACVISTPAQVMADNTPIVTEYQTTETQCQKDLQGQNANATGWEKAHPATRLPEAPSGKPACVVKAQGVEYTIWGTGAAEYACAAVHGPS